MLWICLGVNNAPFTYFQLSVYPIYSDSNLKLQPFEDPNSYSNVLL